jgi:hypothetical protein
VTIETTRALSDEEISRRAAEFANSFFAPAGVTGSHGVAMGRAAAAGPYLWKHLAINFVNGSRLLLGGGPLRASRIRVYATDIQWQYALSENAVVTTPNGNGQTAPGGWRFPGAPIFGVVLYQPNGAQFSITGSSPETAQEFSLSNVYDILVAVNDGSTTQDGYNDNSGAFSLVIEILQG